MKNFFKQFPTLSTNLIITLTVIYIMLVNNQTFWSALFRVVDISRMDHKLFILSVTALIFCLLFILISLFSFRPVFKPAIFIIVITSSVIAYFMDNYGTIIDTSMIQNVMETDSAEAGELLSPSLFAHVILFGIVPAFIISRFKSGNNSILKEIMSRALALILVVGLTATGIYFSYKDVSFILRENKHITYLINPVYPLRSVIKYYRDRQPADKQPLQTVFDDAHLAQPNADKSRPSVFVIVLGETARAHNFHINGYRRNTTPHMEQEKLINFIDTSSCGTATAISVPCIFSELGHDNYDDTVASNSENLLDALHHAGIDVLWRDNNSGCKGVCDRIATENMHHLNIGDYCTADGCFDEVLLFRLQDYIDKLQQDAVIVLHQQGSHGPSYYKRYPREFAVFQPACDKPDVQNCSYDEIVNAYDNTILYTDYFLSQVIELLKSSADTHDTAMLYVSDHGESLGENGIFLHGLPYMIAPEQQTKVPFMVWLSDSFAEHMQIDTACLEQQQSLPHSHDNILHSVLGVMGVSTQRYNRELDIFSGCHSHMSHRSIARTEPSHKATESSTL